MSWKCAQLLLALTKCCNNVQQAIKIVDEHAKTIKNWKSAAMFLPVKFLELDKAVNVELSLKVNGQKVSVIKLCSTLKCGDKIPQERAQSFFIRL